MMDGNTIHGFLEEAYDAGWRDYEKALLTASAQVRDYKDVMEGLANAEAARINKDESIRRIILDGGLVAYSSDLAVRRLGQASKTRLARDYDVRKWVNDHCELGESCFEQTLVLFESWKRYCESQCFAPGSVRWFSLTLKELGFGYAKRVGFGRQARGYRGLRLS